MKTKILLALALCSFSLTINAQKTSFKKQIETISTALKQKNHTLLKTVLAPGYTIKGIPKQYEDAALVQLIDQLPPHEKYSIVSEVKEKNGTRIKINYFIKGENFPADYLIDAKGKVSEFNILNTADVKVIAE